ncbi:hypothetical protein K402DRAFT_421448 [Aulographum hederae CBS 113979]|uniref:Uncharacterized protein n=1 Tax=Aulographum hederae CBS 113979 TaxID=1176131 RepID=A0A6G1GZR0_9PEZI|nr:hypothetical protein K402DRAFT_421448 [Aulographum hederae CBS 113979]
MREPTGADYTAIFDVERGAIISEYAFSPTAMIEKEHLSTTTPPLSRWSDITWLTWERLAAAANKPTSSLRHIIRREISNPTTQAILTSILARTSYPQDIPLLPGTWPGPLTVSMDSDAGKALLASPNGYGVAWMLVERREAMGAKRVKSATCLRDGEGKWSVGFEIEDVEGDGSGEGKPWRGVEEDD